MLGPMPRDMAEGAATSTIGPGGQSTECLVLCILLRGQFLSLSSTLLELGPPVLGILEVLAGEKGAHP